jgi:hypothetical protein
MLNMMHFSDAGVIDTSAESAALGVEPAPLVSEETVGDEFRQALDKADCHSVIDIAPDYFEHYQNMSDSKHGDFEKIDSTDKYNVGNATILQILLEDCLKHACTDCDKIGALNMALYTEALMRLYAIQGRSKDFDHSWQLRTNQCLVKNGFDPLYTVAGHCDDCGVPGKATPTLLGCPKP